jgi:hypothetical protein
MENFWMHAVVIPAFITGISYLVLRSLSDHNEY